MDSFWYHLYDKICLPLLYIMFRLFALTNSKIRKGIQGRKDTFRKIEKGLSLFSDRGPRFWIHSSSMGEFEQAKPLVQQLKSRIPECVVIVSVFSPSAYEHIQDYQKADLICYLPIDTRQNAKRFISILKPDAGIMVRHDLWPNHLRQLIKTDGIFLFFN
jgi:3-deoxy-D-manno-octulosonic-acid transferase